MFSWGSHSCEYFGGDGGGGGDNGGYPLRGHGGAWNQELALQNMASKTILLHSNMEYISSRSATFVHKEFYKLEFQSNRKTFYFHFVFLLCLNLILKNCIQTYYASKLFNCKLCTILLRIGHCIIHQ
jgi:hypothetical protein